MISKMSLISDELSRRRKTEYKDKVNSYYSKQKEKEIYDEAIRNVKRLDKEESDKKFKRNLVIGGLVVGSYVGIRALKSNKKTSVRIKSKGLRL